MDIQTNQFLSINQMADRYLNGSSDKQNVNDSSKASFFDILSQKENDNAENVRFSKHAKVRLEDRKIDLTEEQLERLNTGARKASEKGIKESLVIVDKLAFIVNVPNNTVITAMDSSETDDNVFTNINGAVII